MSHQLRSAVIAVAALGLGLTAHAVEHDLSVAGPTTVNVTGGFGGTAIFSDNWSQPTGTGVFDPFLTLDSNGKTSTKNKSIESAYNSWAMGPQHPDLYLDQHRPEWNTYLRVNELASIKIENVNYFGFILDSNEPGGDKALISIDNIRVYTSSVDNTANVANDITKLDDLGTLRWAMNTPLSTGTSPPDLNGFNVTEWVKLDSSQENVYHNANGGSGQGDMIVYIPQAAFGSSVGTNDFVWFYNLNGVHFSSDKDFAAECGYEEWRAVKGPQDVPDNASSLTLVGMGLAALGWAARRRKSTIAI